MIDYDFQPGLPDKIDIEISQQLFPVVLEHPLWHIKSADLFDRCSLEVLAKIHPLYLLQFGRRHIESAAIHEDDILTIALFHPSRTDLIENVNYINEKVGFRVVNGKIDIPDIPSIHVAGLTLEEAKTLLEESYREQIQDTEIFIEYRDT